jgi:hypothetical protein
MAASVRIPPRRYRVFTHATIEQIEQLERLRPDDRLAMKAVSAVLPFRVNNYVLDELIDWNNLPGDPMFQLTFPQRGMLDPAEFDRMVFVHAREGPIDGVAEVAGEKVFVLKMLQGRDLNWVGRVASFDPGATWLSDLRPAFGEPEFFFEPLMRKVGEGTKPDLWVSRVVRTPKIHVVAEME